MDSAKRAALEAAGVRFTTVEDFLGLTEDERKLVEFRARLAKLIRANRLAKGLTQKQMAVALKTTQPRIAKIEAGSADVSLDQMLRGFYVTGGSDASLLAGSTSERKLAKKSRETTTSRN